MDSLAARGGNPVHRTGVHGLAGGVFDPPAPVYYYRYAAGYETTDDAFISNEQIGNATGLSNLMRNLGGGVGIAAMTTLLARHAQAHQAVLVAHVTRPLYADEASKLLKRLRGRRIVLD